MGFSAEGEGKVGGRFERHAQAGFVDDEVDGFGPEGTFVGRKVWMDDSVLALPELVDGGVWLNRAEFADGFDDAFCWGRDFFWVYFIEIVAIGFPVLVKNQGEVEAGELV